MKNFTAFIDQNDIHKEAWDRITEILNSEIKVDFEDQHIYHNPRYNKQETTFSINDEDPFSGVLNYLYNKSKGKIENEVTFKSSSVYENDYKMQPKNIVLFSDNNNIFSSGNVPGSWICIDFREKRLIPTHYTIKSINWEHNMKNWIVEGSDNLAFYWVRIDQQDNCAELNGPSLIHTFTINNETHSKFRYIRIKSTGVDWCGNNILAFCSFEIYGTLIEYWKHAN